MIKRWQVTAQVNMCAEKIVRTIVKANTERKAKIIAENEFSKQGYFHIHIRSCKEMDIEEK